MPTELFPVIYFECPPRPFRRTRTAIQEAQRTSRKNLGQPRCEPCTVEDLRPGLLIKSMILEWTQGVCASRQHPREIEPGEHEDEPPEGNKQNTQAAGVVGFATNLCCVFLNGEKRP